jgi:hypothetical protein
MTPDDGRQQMWRGAVRAFDLVAAALANPVPKLLADLATPEETLRDLERELPLVYFSPFGALPKDITYDRGEPVRPSVGAAGTTDLLTERETTRSDAERGTARSLTHAASPEARPPVFSFRRRERGVQEGSMNADVARGHSRVPRAAPEVPAYPDPSASERPEMMYVRGDVGFAGDAFQSAVNYMALLDDLAEHALGAGKSRTRDIPAHPANTPSQAVRSREPARKAYGGETAEPLYPPGRDGRWEEGQVAATDLRKTKSGDGVTALVGSLAEDLFSFPVRDLSAFAAPDGAFEEPADELSSETGTDDGVPEKVPGQYVDPEAFAALINDVLVRQARRHGVDMS